MHRCPKCDRECLCETGEMSDYFWPYDICTHDCQAELDAQRDAEPPGVSAQRDGEVNCVQEDI